MDFGQRDALPRLRDCFLVAELGRGRFGVVYKAWWLTEPARLVALKLLNFTGDMERGRFEREIRVLREIDSPHVVRSLDSGWAGDMPYHIMELIHGVHLDEYVATVAKSLEARLRIFQRVCNGVADAHRYDVVHRDLKPKNILVDSEGQPHILDFGICALAPDGWGSSTRGGMTHVGDIIGTLKYMSPEQAWGGVNGPVDKRSDLWALGILLHELCTNGGYPYDLSPTSDKSAQEALLERIRKELPRSPSLRHLPRGRDLEVLLERLLAWDPVDRLDSAAQLGEDIGRYLADQRIVTRAPSLSCRVRRLATGVATKSRAAALVALAMFVPLGLAGATWLLNVRWREAGAACFTHIAAAHPGRDAQRSRSGPPSDVDAAPLATLDLSASDLAAARGATRIVGLFDDTIPSVVRFAQERGLPGVTPDIRTWRGVHGSFMARLATAAPRAVVWDYFFATPQEGDAALAEGAVALRQVGVPVIFAARTFEPTGQPVLSPRLLSALGSQLLYGSIFARDMVEREGEFVIAFRTPAGAVVPGLALATAAAVFHPDCVLDLDWPHRSTQPILLYRTSAGGYLRQRDLLEPTRVVPAPENSPWIESGSLTAVRAFSLDRPERWLTRTVTYEEVLTAPDATLRDLVEGKVVVIGDLRSRATTAGADRHDVRFGDDVVRDVPGCFLLGDAIAGMLSNRYLRCAFPLSARTLALVLTLAAVGCAVPPLLARLRILESSPARGGVCAAFVVLGGGGVGLMTVAESFWAVHLGLAAAALSFPLAGAFWIEFARRRHVLRDRELKAVQSFQFDTGGTITLFRRPATSLPEAPAPH